MKKNPFSFFVKWAVVKMIKKIESFNKTYLTPLKPEIRLMDVLSELGEFSKEIIKAENYGSEDFKLTDDMKLEYGDLVYSLLSFGIENNIDIEEAVDKVLKKYENRFSKKGHIGSNE